MGHGRATQVNVNLSRDSGDYAMIRRVTAMRLFIVPLIAVIAAAGGARAQTPEAAACREGPPDVAIPACTEILKSSRLAPEARATSLLKRGDAFTKRRDFNAAIADYDEAIKLNLKTGVAHNQRGIALRVKGDYDAAIESYNISIKMQPQYSVRYMNRAIAYRWKREFDRALADLDTAIKISPENARLYVERAIVHRLKLDLPRALADNNEAIKRDRNAWQPYQERAITHEARNDLKAALLDYRQALAIAPRNERLTRAVARVEFRIANPESQAAAPEIKQPVPGQAQAPTAVIRHSGRRVALIVGNSRYSNAGPLTNPANDAEILSKALRAVGFTQVNLKLDLSREQLATALKEFAAVADRAEWAVIYFAGHGIEVGGINYLVPVDARLASDRDVAFESVTLDQVLQTVEGASKLRLVILDACRDNPFAKKMNRSSATRSIGRGLGNIEPEGATLVAYAAKHGQTAEDGTAGNSPFAAALARTIQTPGLEINLVFRKVRDEVLAATGKRQEPFTYGSLPSEAFYFQSR